MPCRNKITFQLMISPKDTPLCRQSESSYASRSLRSWRFHLLGVPVQIKKTLYSFHVALENQSKTFQRKALINMLDTLGLSGKKSGKAARCNDHRFLAQI